LIHGGAAVNQGEIVDCLAELSERLGIKVRWEALMGDGGICELRGKRYLFVDRSNDLNTQVEVMTDALCDEPIDNVYIIPEVRDLLERARAQKRAREEREKR
jgi:hypothetical protein